MENNNYTGAIGRLSHASINPTDCRRGEAAPRLKFQHLFPFHRGGGDNIVRKLLPCVRDYLREQVTRAEIIRAAALRSAGYLASRELSRLGYPTPETRGASLRIDPAGRGTHVLICSILPLFRSQLYNGDEMLDAWKRAVVHIEGAGDSFYRSFFQMSEDLRTGKISAEEFAVASRTGRDARSNGTAVFIRDRGRRFLITARHVIHDRIRAAGEINDEEQRASSMALGYFKERALHRLFHCIFRVPSLSDLEQNFKEPRKEIRLSDKPDSTAVLFACLSHLDVGPPEMHSYTLDIERDLAVISLDHSHSYFADSLESDGYVPMDSEVFTNCAFSEGLEVFTIGFPGSVSIVGRQPLDPPELNWASALVSLPACSFGHVSMNHERLDFFWCDLSAYPGNSGGPIVDRNSRCLGIVTGGATVVPEWENEPLEGFSVSIPFTRAVKAKYVRALLERQHEKDRNAYEWSRPHELEGTSEHAEPPPAPEPKLRS